jgi:hypothetical protein
MEGNHHEAPSLGDNDGQRVAEEAPDRGHGNEAGEPVDVQESPAFRHALIVTSFRKRWKASFAGKTRGLLTVAIDHRSLLTRFHEEPK